MTTQATVVTAESLKAQIAALVAQLAAVGLTVADFKKALPALTAAVTEAA